MDYGLTGSMRKIIPMTAAVLATLNPGSAPAQDSPDVVVMRRVISPKDPTHVAGPQYQLVPTTARVAATSFPLLDSSVTVDTTVDPMCVDSKGQQTDASNCTRGGKGVGQFKIAATGSQVVRTIVISRAELLSKLQGVEQAEALCSSTISVAGETWRLSCSPEDIAGEYARLPGAITIPPTTYPFPDGKLTLSTVNSSAVCVDMRTGETVPTCPDNATAGPGYGQFTVATKSEPQMGLVAVSLEEVQAAVPTLAAAETQKICAVAVQAGQYAWRTTCNEDDLRVHYAKVPTAVVANTITLSGPSEGQPNYTRSIDVSTNAGGVKCIDTDTGLAVAGSICDYLPAPASLGTFPVQATFSPSYRTYVVDKAAILAIAPTITDFGGVCAVNSYIDVVGGNDEWWAGRCDMSAIANQYAKIVKTFASGAIVATPATPIPSGPNYTGSITLTPGTVICRDTSTGKPATDSTRCNTLANPGPIAIPATYSPDLRRFAVKWTDALAKYPEVASLCQTNAYVVPSSGTQQMWQIACSEEEVRNHYDIRPSTVSVNDYAIGPSLDGRPNFTANLTLNTSNSPSCYDTDTGAKLGAAGSVRVCQYLPTPKISTAKPVAATFSPTYRKAYINPADVAAFAPDVAQNTYCNAYFIAADYKPWYTTCNQADVRVHHRKVVNNVYVSYASGTVLAAGPVGFTIEGASKTPYGCIDTDNGARVAITTQTCGNLPNPAVPSTKVPVTRSDVGARTLWVSRAAILAILPDLDMGSFCTSTTIDDVKYQSWQVRCDP